MNRRDRAIVAVLSILLIVLGGALALPRAVTQQPTAAAATPTPSIPPPAVYREGVVGTPTSITPVTARNRAERTLVGLIFSGLVRLGPGNLLQPDLATSWTVADDGRTWTFRLRDGATWQDGVPVTAEDVAFTVRTLQSPEASGAVSAFWAEVRASALDAQTVKFTLDTPIGGFLAALTQPILPAHLLADVALADIATDPFSRLPVGTGPFALSELDATHAVLTPAALAGPPQAATSPTPTDALANPAPSSPRTTTLPYLDRIEVRFYPDNEALAAAFRDGEIDAAAGLPAAMAKASSSLSGARLVRYPTTTLSTVLLDLRPTHPELRDARVRRALLAAIDRGRLVSDVLGGDALLAQTMVPPASWAYDAAAAGSTAFDRKAASALLTSAGWTKKSGHWLAPHGKSAYRLEILSVPADANPRLAAIAGFVRDAWTTLGFRVDLVEVPATELGTKLREGSFTAALVDVAMGVDPDLYPLLDSAQVRGSGSNLAGFQDTTLDPILEKARAPGTLEVRTAAWKSLLTALAARQPMLPLAWADELVVVRGVEGMSPRLIATPGDRFWDVLAWRLAADR